jgi:kumamolisin
MPLPGASREARGHTHTPEEEEIPPLQLSKRAKRRVIAAAAAAAIIPAAALTVSSAASASAPISKVAVSQGISPAVLADATPFAGTAANTAEAVSFVLRGRNLTSLAAAVESGHGPSLTVSQFASQYGQSPSTVAALESYLAKFDISVTTAYADGLDIATTGTAGQYDAALAVTQQQYRIPALKGRGGHKAEVVHGTRQTLELPASIGNDVLAVLGLTNYAPFSDNLTHTPSEVKVSNSTTPTATLTGNLTPADFATSYDLNPLYKDGINGLGETIGIITLAGLNPTTPEHFWNNVLNLNTPADRISVDNVDGGPGPANEVAGSGESDLDVEQSGALAPDASIIVYQAPNTDAGYADAVFEAASDNVADSVSSSWGESETIVSSLVDEGQETAAYEGAFDEGFLEMAAQKQSMFASAGDQGAYDASDDLGSTNLSVDTPGDSPFITSAGGTTLGGTVSDNLVTPLGSTNIIVNIPEQRAWGWDWMWPTYAQWGSSSEAAFVPGQIGGGGGGFSTIEPTPLYQDLVTGTHTYHAVEYLQPSQFSTDAGPDLPWSWNFNATPSITSGKASGRAEPDVSANADPFTGYLLYDPLSAPALQGGWGGTSFVAPQLNGSTALIDQYVGHRVGFWNPSIYAFAASGHDPFTPLSSASTSNDNLYYTGNPGMEYNPATGLGVPNLAKLAYDFAKQ